MAKDKDGDVKMDGEEKKEEKKEEKEPPLTPAQVLAKQFAEDVKLITEATKEQDFRQLDKLSRRIIEERKGMLGDVLARHVAALCSEPRAPLLLAVLPAPETVEGEPPAAAGLEAELWFALLTLVYLLDQKKPAEALALGDKLLTQLAGDNRPSLRFFVHKYWFYTCRAYELTGKLAEVRPRLNAAFRTACLHHDEAGQATLLNLLLRNYLHYNLYDQAVKLISKTSFPDARVNAQYARYLYYLARVKAVQLEYSDAFQYVQQALRKGPKPESKFGRGFRGVTTKLMVVVQLLMGEIPEKSIFMQSDLKDLLAPYLKITRAVRLGDLNNFREAMTEHEKVFAADQTLSLIKRLRHNVIKTGLRSINVSYSCIGLADVASKLGLDAGQGAEGIVAKAIADGVIDASLNHGEKYLSSKPMADVYSTCVPQQALHKRIDFCLQLHNEAVKAMRYPGEGKSAEEMENEEERRERDKALMAAADNAEFSDEDDLFM